MGPKGGARQCLLCHPGPTAKLNGEPYFKDAAVKRYHYECHDQLKAQLPTFLMAYTFAKRLKTRKGLTPYEVCMHLLGKRTWTLCRQLTPSYCGTKQLA